ncbi:MAG: hypothetical protein KF897_03210 [Opitutaceae bacterium]|nr:hypothetical protein [Opitutaceae bacterium]
MEHRPLQSLVIRRTDRYTTENPVDLGFLCEAMLFYGHVLVVADPVVIKQLIRKVGIDTLLALISSGFLKVHFCPKQLGLMNGGQKKLNHYSPLRFAFVKQPIEIFQEVIFESVPKEGRSRRLAQRLATALPTTDYSLSVEPAFRSAIQDRTYLKRAFLELLRYNLRTESPPDFDFDLSMEGDDIVFRSTLDYTRLNETFQKILPGHSLTDSLLLCDLMEIQADIRFAAEYASEIATDPRNQLLHRLEEDRALAQFNRSQSELERFHETVFPDSRDIRTAINSGARTIDEFLPLLEKAARFRSWLKERPDDVPLIADYFRAATEETWISRLPAKTVRWAVFVAAGEAVAPGGWMAGAALSAADTFFLDRFLKRWSPNQFINGEYKRFLSDQG